MGSSSRETADPAPKLVHFSAATPVSQATVPIFRFEHDIVNGHSRMDYQPRHSPNDTAVFWRPEYSDIWMNRGDDGKDHYLVAIRKDFHGMLTIVVDRQRYAISADAETVEHSNGTSPTIPHVDVEAAELEAQYVRNRSAERLRRKTPRDNGAAEKGRRSGKAERYSRPRAQGGKASPKPLVQQPSEPEPAVLQLREQLAEALSNRKSSKRPCNCSKPPTKSYKGVRQGPLCQ